MRFQYTMKLRALIFLFLCFTGIYTLAGKESQVREQKEGIISIDILSLLTDGRLVIEGGFGFCSKWSITGCAKINLIGMGKGLSSEERNHEDQLSELNGDKEINGSNIFHEAEFSFRHWIKDIWKGFYISAGGSINNRFAPDCLIGTGYMIQIWRGLSMDINICRKIIENKNKIRIGISYVF